MSLFHTNLVIHLLSANNPTVGITTGNNISNKNSKEDSDKRKIIESKKKI